MVSAQEMRFELTLDRWHHSQGTGVSWGKSGYSQRPRRLPRCCSFTHIPHCTCPQVPLILPLSMHTSSVPSVVSDYLFETLWTVAPQAPLFMGFSRQEYWSGFPFPLPGDLLTQGSNPHLLCLLDCRWIPYPLSHLGSLS